MTKEKEYNCFMCDTLLVDENCSLEHVILNSCGGKLRSTNLLCKLCNSRLGADADTELSNQLSFFSTFINVDRDRGNLQPIKSLTRKDGENYTLLPGEVNKPVLSKPNVKKETNGNKTEISISASDIKIVDKIFSDLKKKHPSFNIEKAKEQLVISSGYISDSLNYSHKIGGGLAFRSIVKTGIEFFILSGGESKYIKHLIPYLNGTENLELIWFAPFIETPYDLDNTEISHFLYVKADRKEKVVFAFVDFFNAYPFFICLNDTYDGYNFEQSYCYDLINKMEIDKNFNLCLNREQVLKLSKKSQPSNEEFMALQKRIGRTLAIADDRQASKELSRIIKDSFTTTISKLGWKIQMKLVLLHF